MYGGKIFKWLRSYFVQWDISIAWADKSECELVFVKFRCMSISKDGFCAFSDPIGVSNSYRVAMFASVTYCVQVNSRPVLVVVCLRKKII